MDSLLETQAPSQTPRPQRSYPLDHYMDRKVTRSDLITRSFTSKSFKPLRLIDFACEIRVSNYANVQLQLESMIQRVVIPTGLHTNSFDQDQKRTDTRSSDCCSFTTLDYLISF